MINEINRDKALFALIAAGDEQAFRELFHLYVPQLTPVILDIIKTDAFTRDVVQEIFLSLWIGRDKLPAVEVPRNWIFRIAYNHSYGWLQKQLVREKANAAGGEQDVLQHTTEEQLTFNETVRLIKHAVHALGPRAQQIYRLSREAGYKPADIAGMLGISTQSVKNSLHRSGQAIKDHLARHGIIVPLVCILGYLH